MPTTLDRPDSATTGPDDGATLEVEYTRDGAVLRVTSGPDDTDAGARLLCAAVAHVRRRHARRAHTALDLSTPAGGAYLAALRSRVGTDVNAIAMRRAGSSVMVTLDLLPAPRSRTTRTRPSPTRP
jgi:hypothetical protein